MFLGKVLLILALLYTPLAQGQQSTREIKDINRKIDSLFNLAIDDARQADYQGTIRTFEKARELASGINNRSRVAIINSSLASVYKQLEQYDKASKAIVKAIDMQRELEENDKLAGSYLSYAQINLKVKDYEKAGNYLSKAEDLAADFEDGFLLAQLALTKGDLLSIKDSPSEALPYYDTALEYFDQQRSSTYFLALTLLQKAKAMEKLERYDDAESFGKKSHDISKAENKQQIEVESLQLLSRILNKKGHFKEAFGYLEEYQAKQEALVKLGQIGKDPGVRNAFIAEIPPYDSASKRSIPTNKITTVVVIALFTILCLLALSLYKNNNIRAKANELLQEKNTELFKAKEKAEKASMVKAQFLSTITHELRTPMYAVTGLTHLLLSEDPTEEQKKHLDSLKFSGEYLLSLINNILDLNKLEANKVEVEYTTFELKKRVDDVIFALTRSAQEKGNRLQLEYDKGIPRQIMGDPLMISQVLINLIGNGNKFTREGDITVRIKKISENDTQIYLHFEVEDTGEGISKKKQKNIFQNFTQGSVQINRKFGGTGLGLSIVKRLLHLQNSKIELESTLGKGSRFFFDIKYAVPKNADRIMDQEEEFNIDYTSLEGRSILVVEDNKINQMITRKILEKHKIVCDVADNGEIAIEKVRFKDYDLVLMDIHMPGISGIEATKKIRQFNTDLPILALTAVTIDEKIDEFYLAGFNDIIPKPYKVEEFFHKIHKALSKDESVFKGNS